MRLGEPEFTGFLPELGTDRRVSSVLDEVSCLRLGVPTHDVSAALLRDHRRVLERRHRTLEQPDDGRHVGPWVPRAHGEDGLTAGGVHGSDDEVALPAETRVQPRADVAAVGLVEEVDAEGGVDARHGGVGGDPARVVDDLGAPHPDPRVLVQPGHEARSTDRERRDDVAFVVERTRVVEVEDAVRDHLAPDAEAPSGGQSGDDRVRDGADAELQRGAGADPLGDMGSDALDLGRGRRCPVPPPGSRGRLEQDCVQVVGPELGVAERERHVVVGLGDDDSTGGTARLQRGRNDVDLCSEGECAGSVGR